MACGTASKWVLFGTGAKVDGLGVALDLKKWMKKIFSLMKHFFTMQKLGSECLLKKVGSDFLGGKVGFYFLFWKQNWWKH